MAKTEKINPIILTTENGTQYTLEFSRDSVRFAEHMGFDITTYRKRWETGIGDFFFYAFHKNHQDVSKEETDKILVELGGLLPDEVARLENLYMAAVTTININGERKNSKARMTL